MIKIGLTGNIASGKSYIEELLKQKGIPVIDADEIVHEVLENNTSVINHIKKLFHGYDVLQNDKLSRPKVGRVVFRDEKKRRQLENILHPIVKIEIQNFFDKNQDKPMAVASVPLLFETNMQSLFDKVILIVADEKIRLERLMKRNNLTEIEALERIKSQQSQESKIPLADFIINNSLTPESTKSQLLRILDAIL